MGRRITVYYSNKSTNTFELTNPIDIDMIIEEGDDIWMKRIYTHDLQLQNIAACLKKHGLDEDG